MSLQSSVGNVTRSATESVKSILSTTTGKIENTIGTATTAVTNVWSGGFAGISTANATALENAINTYIQGIQDTIQGFNENANLENAYKGAAQEGAQVLLRESKSLLQAYVSLMKRSVNDFHDAVERYVQAAGDLGTKISQQADEIRANAESIKMD